MPSPRRDAFLWGADATSHAYVTNCWTAAHQGPRRAEGGVEGRSIRQTSSATHTQGRRANVGNT